MCRLPADARPVAALVLAIAASLVIVVHPIFDYDLYWHLAYGREMARLGAIVSTEPFSFTAPGVAFTNREWLAQWIFYLIWQGAGWDGLLIFKLVVAALVVTLIFRTALFLDSRPWIAAVAATAAVLAGLYRFVERPELFTLLFVALLGFLVAGWQRRRLDARWLGLIPPVMLVWDWLHGAIYGAAMLLVVAAVENLRVSGDHRPALRPFNIACGAALVLMAANPFGLRTYGEFLSHLEGVRGGVVDNMEYLPPLSWNDLAFWGLVAMTLASGALLPRRLPLAQALVTVALGFLACRISRVVGVFALVAAPLVASQLSAAFAAGEIRAKAAKGMALSLLVFVVAVGAWIKFLAPPRPQSFGWGVDEQYLPAGAVRFVIDHGLDGRFFNSGHIGGYLAWKLYPERRVFQYNHGAMFGDTYRFVRDPKLLAPYGVRYAFVASANEVSRLFPDSEWARIYRDPGGVLVLRRLPEFSALIARYETRLYHPMLPPAQLDRIAARQLPRLLEEMTVYLAYRDDPAAARQWLRLADSNRPAAAAIGLREELQRAAQRHPELAGYVGATFSETHFIRQ